AAAQHGPRVRQTTPGIGGVLIALDRTREIRDRALDRGSRALVPVIPPLSDDAVRCRVDGSRTRSYAAQQLGCFGRRRNTQLVLQSTAEVARSRLGACAVAARDEQLHQVAKRAFVERR